MADWEAPGEAALRTRCTEILEIRMSPAVVVELLVCQGAMVVV